jgi:hypothetical protein
MAPTDNAPRSRDRHRILFAALRIAAVTCLAGASVLPASAKADGQADGQPGQAAVAAPPSDPPKLEFLVDPYVWVPWVYSGVHPYRNLLPSTSATTGPDKLVKHITWIPFIGAAEVRSGAFGVFVDYLHAPLSAGVQTGRVILGNGSAGVGVDTGTAMVFYRPLRGPVNTLDVGIGMRAWGVDGGITLSRAPLPLPDINVAKGFAFADPLIGARYRRDLGKGYAATAYGDVGGGAGADLQWQVVAAIDYKKPSWPELHLGFRSESFSYKASSARLIMTMFGPVFGATFRY